MKNLRAKDYLGKAKLVAAVDKNNAYTGFTGAELKRMNSVNAAKDDRPEANISFAASNLVKSDLKSRYRQQSEPPPPNRDMFPPTPPPDNDRVSATSSNNGGNRFESGRNNPKLKPLDLSNAGFGSNRAELGRTMSERSDRPPGTRSRGLSNNSTGQRPLLGNGPGGPEYDDVYDLYGRAAAGLGAGSAGQTTTSNNRSRAGTTRSTPGYISEEEEGGNNSYDEPDFDMMSVRSSGRPRPSVPDVKKIRVKVHADDTRYVMVGPAIEFKDFVDQIRSKFGIRQNFKVKIKDDGDMITMSDQDDLDMAVMQSKSEARKERNEMAKMEVRSNIWQNSHVFALC